MLSAGDKFLLNMHFLWWWSCTGCVCETNFAVVNCTRLVWLVQGRSHLSHIDQECCSSLCVDRLLIKEQNLGRIGLGREGQAASFAHSTNWFFTHFSASVVLHPCCMSMSRAFNWCCFVLKCFQHTECFCLDRSLQ